MVDPSMMEIIDHLLQCNDEELREVFNPNINEEEITTRNQNKHGMHVANQVNINVDTPTTNDVNTLSLRDLLDIERKLDRDSPPENKTIASHEFIKSSTNFIGSGGNESSSTQFNIDDIICGDELQDDEKNVDFAIDSDDKITSYIDCMEPSSSKRLPSYDSTMMGMNVADPPEISSLLNFPASTEICSASIIPTYTNTTDFGGVFDFVNNESSATPTHITAGMKRSFPDEPSFESSFETPNKLKFSEKVEDSSSDSDVSTTHGGEFNDTVPDEKDEFEGITDRKEIRKLKNNKASRVHRAKKKLKRKELFAQQVDFEKRNAALRMKVESMEKEIEFLKELLLVKAAATPNI